MRWLENITGGYSSSAKVVDNTLVLSLPDARSPVVWRMELNEIKAAAFEVEQEEKGGFMLVMKNPKGDDQNIAPFDNKAKAIKALMAASRAMEQTQNAAGSAAAANSNEAAISSGQTASKAKSNPFMLLIVGVIILVGLVFVLNSVGPRPPQSFETTANTESSGQSGFETPVSRPGVPMSADDFLRGNQ